MLQNSFSLEIQEDFLKFPRCQSPLVNYEDIYFKFKFWEKDQIDRIEIPYRFVLFNELTNIIHRRWVKSEKSRFTFKYLLGPHTYTGSASIIRNTSMDPYIVTWDEYEKAETEEEKEIGKIGIFILYIYIYIYRR